VQQAAATVPRVKHLHSLMSGGQEAGAVWEPADGGDGACRRRLAGPLAAHGEVAQQAGGAHIVESHLEGQSNKRAEKKMELRKQADGMLESS